MNRATCQPISRDLVSHRRAGCWIDCVLVPGDDVSVAGPVLAGDADSTQHVVSANQRIRMLFPQGLGSLGNFLARSAPTLVTRTR
jgi:hypothetical protein